MYIRQIICSENKNLPPSIKTAAVAKSQTLPKMFFMRTVHFRLCGTQFHITAAFFTGTFSEKITAFAYFKSAAVFRFRSFSPLRKRVNHFPDRSVNSGQIGFRQQTFAAKRLAHESITETTEQGGSTAEILPLDNAALNAFGTTFSGEPKSLNA